MNTTLSTITISRLIARITDGELKRSATKEVAIKRFVSVLIERLGENKAKLVITSMLAESNYEDALKVLENWLAKPEDNKEPICGATPADQGIAAAKEDDAIVSEAEQPKTKAAFDTILAIDTTLLSIIRTIGPAKVGAFRAEWKRIDPKKYGVLAPTQQRGIMRKAINRLVVANSVSRNGSIFAIVV